ncbi:hypothetical protein QFZ34_001264 [Phyllobacterium ifriqiyense]|uniref:DUF2569 domain-containing protein n=1 Tax=Phyllobacterium ifriqiyense TaxID=314238 RepID=A0ABU0S5P5_9HYPH|nr:DUF2569 family protein [Phyllobacterium ifriqiyense]MDQ0996087.1 hypothetical protein [Phyllobacterium ifriqiyense]
MNKVDGRSIPIGGWLIFLVILISGNVLDGLWSFIDLLRSAYFSPETLSIRLKSSYTPKTWWLVLFVLIGTIAVALVALYALKLALATDVRAPKWMIRLVTFQAVFSTFWIVYILIAYTPVAGDISEVMRAARTPIRTAAIDIAVCAIVVPYLLRSKRVKETFVIQ